MQSYNVIIHKNSVYLLCNNFCPAISTGSVRATRFLLLLFFVSVSRTLSPVRLSFRPIQPDFSFCRGHNDSASGSGTRPVERDVRIFLLFFHSIIINTPLSEVIWSARKRLFREIYTYRRS